MQRTYLHYKNLAHAEEQQLQSCQILLILYPAITMARELHHFHEIHNTDISE